VQDLLAARVFAEYVCAAAVRPTSSTQD